MATKTASPPSFPPQAPSAQQISASARGQAIRFHNARLAIEQAVQACAGKDWTPEHVHDMAQVFLEMLDKANDPSA